MWINRKHWIEKFNIPDTAEVIFYQNPDFYRSNSFERDYITDPDLKLKKAIYRMYTITGVCNNHHKNSGKRQKICFVIERDKIKHISEKKEFATKINEEIRVNWPVW